MQFSEEQRFKLYEANLARSIEYYRHGSQSPVTKCLSSALLGQIGASYYHARAAGGYEIDAYHGLALATPENVKCLQTVLPSLIELISQAAECLRVSDMQAVLSVVGAREVWRDCLLTYHGSYGLAQCLLSAADMKNHPHLIRYADLVRPHILKIVNDWLKPESPWLDIPNEETIAIALFGSGWWGVCGQHSHGDAVEQVCCSVHGQKPPFMAGMVPWGGPAVALDLPEMGLW
jgi:hypothetical protein